MHDVTWKKELAEDLRERELLMLTRLEKITKPLVHCEAADTQMEEFQQQYYSPKEWSSRKNPSKSTVNNNKGSYKEPQGNV